MRIGGADGPGDCPAFLIVTLEQGEMFSGFTGAPRVEWWRWCVDSSGMDAGSLVSSSANRGDYVLARKALDQVERQGAAAVSMIQSAGEVASSAPRGAVSPVPAATESGLNLDRTA